MAILRGPSIVCGAGLPPARILSRSLAFWNEICFVAEPAAAGRKETVGMNSPPLAGIRVVETARILAGPWAGQLLADLGADTVGTARARGGPIFRRSHEQESGE